MATGGSLEGTQVLLVDDNVAGAQTMAMLLGMSGFQVGVASTGASALEMCCGTAPDIVLLDIGLPDMSGHEVARQIRERMGESAPTIIGVSGWEEDLRPAPESSAEFDFFLTKPVNYDELEQVVRRSIAERRAQGPAVYGKEADTTGRIAPR